MSRCWLRYVLALLAIAAATHVLVVWAIPRLIMQRVMRTTPADLGHPGATPRVYFPPMTDATQRRIVMPSPDLLYAICVFDVSQHPLRVTANPRLSNYWSVAGYADNSDNFFVVNDRQLAGQPLDLVLVGATGSVPSATLPQGARVLVAPSDKGLLLMRVLVSDYEAEKALLEPARRTLRCEPLP